MRKFKLSARRDLSAKAAARNVGVVITGAWLAISSCSPVLGQFPQSPGVVSAAYQSSDKLVSSGVSTPEGGAVDASYSILKDNTTIAPAAYNGRTPARRSTLRQRIAAANYEPVGPINACMGTPGCDVNWYINGEAFALRREGDERFGLSVSNNMGDFDYELGGRITVGRLFNCVNALEFVYAGPFEWEKQSSVTIANGLRSRFSPQGGMDLSDIDAFGASPFSAAVIAQFPQLATVSPATTHTETYTAELNNFEFNRRWWSWDVLSTLIGVRYIDYQEDYSFSSVHANNGNGLYTEAITNRLLGPQAGVDFMYPVTLRLNAGIRGKVAAFANFDERETRLINDGTTVVSNGDNDTDIAGLLELGLFTSYQIVPSIRFTAGYEVWYLAGIATVPEQSPALVNFGSGSDVQESDDLVFHGATLGLQVLY